MTIGYCCDSYGTYDSYACVVYKRDSHAERHVRVTILTVTVDHSIEYAQFLPRRDAMHKRGLPPPCRRVVSVRPSVHFTVCHVRVVCQNELSYLHFFHRRPFFCSYIPNPGNIPTGTLTGASNAGGIWRKWEIAILDQYLYGFIACCQRCDRPVLYIWVLGTMWHAHLGPSQTQKMTS